MNRIASLQEAVEWYEKNIPARQEVIKNMKKEFIVVKKELKKEKARKEKGE